MLPFQPQRGFPKIFRYWANKSHSSYFIDVKKPQSRRVGRKDILGSGSIVCSVLQAATAKLDADFRDREMEKTD
jgi:hypothetical protein